MLAKRVAEISTGTYIEPADRKVTVDELYSALLADYKNNELASLKGAEERWQRPAKEGEELPAAGRLKQFFGGIRALAFTTDMLNRYVASCREQGLSNGTINRDLAAVHGHSSPVCRKQPLPRIPTWEPIPSSAGNMEPFEVCQPSAPD